MTDSAATSGPTADSMSPGNATDRVLLAGGRFAVANSGLFAQWLRGLTINAHERLALAHLWEQGPMTMSELGSRIPLSRAAITALTDRLETLDYVVRTPDRLDRRRTVLSLTNIPMELIRSMQDAWRAGMRDLLADFTPDQLDTIARYLDGARDVCDGQSASLRLRRDEELRLGSGAGRTVAQS